MDSGSCGSMQDDFGVSFFCNPLKVIFMQVSSGDVVILGSDGLWDNISVPDISTLVRQELQNRSRPSRIAQKLLGGCSQRETKQLHAMHRRLPRVQLYHHDYDTRFQCPL